MHQKGNNNNNNNNNNSRKNKRRKTKSESQVAKQAKDRKLKRRAKGLSAWMTP